MLPPAGQISTTNDSLAAETAATGEWLGPCVRGIDLTEMYLKPKIQIDNRHNPIEYIVHGCKNGLLYDLTYFVLIDNFLATMFYAYMYVN